MNLRNEKLDKSVIERLRNGLIVSCQALEKEPLHGASHMVAMARAAEIGGASGIRANGPVDISEIKKVVSLPVIGIHKITFPGYKVFITPTFEVARKSCKGWSGHSRLECHRKETPGRLDSYSIDPGNQARIACSRAG